MLYLTDWIGALKNFLLPGNRFKFLGKQKACISVFVVFTCSCNVKGTFWTIDDSPHFAQPENGSRSSYISVQKHAYSILQFLLKPSTSPIAASFAVSSLDVIIAFTKSTLATKKVSVLVKYVIFVVVVVFNLCKNQLFSVNESFFDGKDTLVVLFKTIRWKYLTVAMFSSDSIAVRKEVVFWQCGALFNFGSP